MKGKYLTERERYVIEELLKAGVAIKQIAQQLDKAVSTIYLEIKRGTVEFLDKDWRTYKKYCADVAQRRYVECSRNKGIDLKIGNDYDFVKFVERKIVKEKYSPKATISYIKTHDMQFKTDICYKTLYNYIDAGLFLNVTNKDLPVKKQEKKQEQHKVVALKNTKGTSIEERPKDVLKRDSFGHWEMDTVYSGQKKGKTCLLVLSERMTRNELIFKMPDRTSASVVRALNRLEKVYGCKRFRETFKTITVDNGSEFLDYEKMEQSCKNKKVKRTTVFYCHPYCSSERGTNENINRMIRRWIPKGANIDLWSKQQIAEIQEWINNYPRDIFGGQSSAQFMKTSGISF